ELAQSTPASGEKAPAKQADGSPPTAPAKQAQGSPAAAPAAQSTEPAPRNDRIEVTMDGDASVVNVYRVSGIGGAQVRSPKSGWPRAVLIRLHGFPELESLKATSRNPPPD